MLAFLVLIHGQTKLWAAAGVTWHDAVSMFRNLRFGMACGSGAVGLDTKFSGGAASCSLEKVSLKRLRLQGSVRLYAGRGACMLRMYMRPRSPSIPSLNAFSINLTCSGL